MRQRNVTITLPEHVLREARHLAVDQGVSLSRFLAFVLEQQVEKARHYRAAAIRQIHALDEGVPIGTGGEITWTREDLHER